VASLKGRTLSQFVWKSSCYTGRREKQKKVADGVEDTKQTWISTSTTNRKTQKVKDFYWEDTQILTRELLRVSLIHPWRGRTMSGSRVAKGRMGDNIPLRSLNWHQPRKCGHTTKAD
jgi:hypothetical protein